MKRKRTRDRQGEQIKGMFKIFFVVSLGLVVWGAEELICCQRSLKWPSVPGVILESRYAGRNDIFTAAILASVGSHLYGAYVTYGYTVEGRQYVSTQISLGSSKLIGGTGRPYQFVQEHPAGTSVLVYYEPGNPENAVLIPGADTFMDKGLMIAGGVAAAMSLFGYYDQVRRMRRKPEPSTLMI